MVPPELQARLAPRLRVRALTRRKLREWGETLSIEATFESRTSTVWLRPRLARGPRPLAVAVILHELAHAAQKAFGLAPPYRARHERAANSLAFMWADRGPLGRAVAAAVRSRGMARPTDRPR